MNVKTIKRFLFVLMFLTALLCVACGKHTHEFGEWVVVTEATEEAEGLKERVCECGEKETQTIEKLAHTHAYGEWVVVKEATEEEEGLKERTCACGEKETEAIEKLAHEHKFGEWVVVKEATETEEGSKERVCACGEKETETIEKLAHTHAFGEWVVVKEPTTEEAGLKERECACGEKETEEIAKLDIVITGTIELVADKVSGKLGEVITVTANVVLDGEGDASLVWLSSDESVATVDEFGVVTLVGAGTAEITASLAANIEVFATIEVSCVPGVEFIQLEANEEYWVGATEELFFFYEPEDVEAEFVWSSSDESICVVDNGVITTLKGGYVEITCATADGEVSQTVAFKVYNYVSEIKVTAEKTMAIQTKQRLIAELGPEPYKASAKFESSDTTILVVDSQGMVTAGNPGKATITVTASDGGDAKAVVEIEVTEPVVDAEITLADPAVDGIARGTEYTFNGMKFIVGYTAFPTLKQAVEVATNTVYVAAGKYEDNITIDKSNFTIVGPNSGINPIQATRLPEAEFTGKITLSAGIEKIAIKGLAFTGTGCLDTQDSVKGIEISYNNIYDTNTEVAAWGEGRSQFETVFDFWNNNGVEATDIVFKYNKFSGVTETNILFARNTNVTVTNNAFFNFGRDAIRCEGGYNFGVWLFDNNVFKNDEVSGYNAIYFQSVSGVDSEGKYQEIVVTNNTFENVGIAENAPSIYVGALSMRTYQEKGLKVDVLYNTFKNCVNYIRFRNNGANADNYTVNINYNAFYGVPAGVYFASINGAGDTNTSNPPLANMDCNFFATLEGSPIVELSEYADKFLDLASYAACYRTKEEYETALKELLGVEFEYVVNPEWKDLEEGAKVEAEGFTWVFGENAFATIDDCISATDEEGAIIKVLAGNYDSELTISKNNITLVGPNQDINAQYENRNNEAVIANKVTIAEGVQNVTINGFELTGAGQILPLADTNNISVKYCVINKTSADGVVRGPAEGNINNLEFSYNYAEGNTSYRIIHITKGLNGLTAVNNYITNAGAYDFLNVGTTTTSFLGGDVLIKDNTYIKSNQSFLYVGGVKAINAVIEGNYLEDIANTGLDFRTMNDEEAAVATFDIKNNTFKNAGCGWCPIRIRTAGYAEGDSIAIYVENNKFIESAYNEGGKPQFLENPSLSSQTDPFKTIYVIGKKYYEWKGEPFTEISGFNFCDAQSSFEEAYATEDEMPEYVVENQVKPTGVQITNKVETMEAFTTHQIAVKLSPEDVTNKKVSYVTSNSNVATVSTAGLITAKSEGTCTITVQCVADKSIVDTMTITVNPKQRIELRYEGNAALLVGETVDVAARVVGVEGTATFKSSDDSIATVDANGKVTAVKDGQVTITATCGELTAEVSFTVLKEEYDGVLGELIKGNNGVLVNQVVKYIGSDDGSADYPHEIYGSANDFWFGQLPEVTRNMLATTAPNYDGREMTSLEWIVIHDTAGSGSTSTAKANSGWCTNPGNTGSSWHYTIGNDGIYQQIEDNMVAWHAGDGISWAENLSAKFYDTGVAYEGDRPVVTVGADRYFYINGKKTTVEIPAEASTTTPINTLGMVCYKGENGNYIIPTTWVSSGFSNPICARGGNIHSIGIETAVNMGSDVWLTWQYTAKFVAQLLVKHNLTPDRVWFHNNFSNKPCPRTMMTAGLVEDFLELVYTEYEVAKNYAGYEIKFESHNTDIMDNTGRIVEAPEFTTNVSYTVTVTKDGQSESVTLNTLVIGKYN